MAMTKAQMEALLLELKTERDAARLEIERLNKATTVKSRQHDTSVSAAKDKAGHGCGVRFFAPKGNKPGGVYAEVTWTTQRGERYARFPMECAELLTANMDKVRHMATD